MALDLWTNTGLSTLASGIDASQTTLTVAAGTGSRFPSANFQLVVWSSTDFANPIDAADREIVRCTSRTGDVLTIVRGQEGTTGVAHNTVGKIYSVALIISKKFRDDVETRLGTIEAMPDAPDKDVEFFEDFLTQVTTGTLQVGANGWGFAGKITGRNLAGGAWGILGDGTVLGEILAIAPGNDASNWVSAAKNPQIKARFTVIGTLDVGTASIGVSDGTSLGAAANPPNGIFLKFTRNAGNYVAVCRAANTETTLDTGVIVDTAYHIVRFVVTGGGTNVEVFIDGVSKGNITTNIPTVLMNPKAISGATGLDRGIDVDYIHVRQNR